MTSMLLVVYAFIATPVQLWHHHSNSVYVGNEKSTKEKVESNDIKAAKQSTDVNCQICSHHYSTYNEVASIESEISSRILTSNKECFIVTIPSSPVLHLSNKGPPAVA